MYWLVVLPMVVKYPPASNRLLEFRMANDVTVELACLIHAFNVPELLNFANRCREEAPENVKLPPAKTFPDPSTAKAKTVELTEALQLTLLPLDRFTALR